MDDERVPFADLRTIADAISGIAEHHRLDRRERDEWEQIAWAKVLGHADVLAGQFRSESSFRTYLGAVINNCYIDWRRQIARKKKPLLTFDDATRSIDLASTRAFYDARIDEDARRVQEQRWALVNAALEHLDPGDRDLLTRYFGDPATRRRLAAEAECRPEALRQRVHRALKKVRQLMSQIRPPARPPNERFAFAERLTPRTPHLALRASPESAKRSLRPSTLLGTT